MTNFRTLEGDIMVGTSAEDDDRIDNGQNLFSEVVFDSSSISLVFESGIGGYYPLEDEHMVQEGSDEFYYPHINETSMSPYVESKKELEVFETDIKIRYMKANGEFYVVSQNEIAAYSPVYFVHNEEPYAARDPLLARPGTEFEGDELLGLDEVSEPIEVENLRTGYSRPLDYDVVADIVDNGNNNGLLRLEKPDDIIRSITRDL